MSIKRLVGCSRKRAGSSGKRPSGSSGKREGGSSEKRRAEEPSVPQSSGGKRQRRDSAAYFDSLDEEELQEEDEPREHPTATRGSPDENAQPGNTEAKQRTMQKPAGADLTLTRCAGVENEKVAAEFCCVKSLSFCMPLHERLAV